MITDEQRARWERGFVYACALLGVGLPILIHLVWEHLPSTYEDWLGAVVVFGVPGLLAASPIAINIFHRAWVFRIGTILVIWVFVSVLLLCAFMFCSGIRSH